MNIRICGTGSALPERKITNDDLSQIMDTSDEWISSRTGIKNKTPCNGRDNNITCHRSCKKALADADMKPEEVELIIAATVTPDHLVPTLSCEVQREIGAVNAVAFDLGAACSGFLFALSTAQAYIASGRFKNALLIGAEVLSKIMDWNDRSTCVLFWRWRRSSSSPGRRRKYLSCGAGLRRCEGTGTGM